MRTGTETGDDKKRVAWILGAGFSVPLGGPLFKDLISRETHRTLSNWRPYANETAKVAVSIDRQYKRFDVDAGALGWLVTELYARGLGEEIGPRLWSDGEQFLDRLEIAAAERDSPLADDIRAILTGCTQNEWKADEPRFLALQSFVDTHGLEQVRREAIRIVAGACTLFLMRAEQNERVVDLSEQWDPYRHWVGKLKPGRDSIITFNYDRTLDILGNYCKRQTGLGPLTSPMHVPAGTFEGEMDTCVPVYHLHGHVGWVGTADGKTCRPLSEPIAHKMPDNAVIGLPGSFKRTLPEGLLKDIWRLAMTALEEADAVVFVGYRFPETDNWSKRKLLDALRVKPKARVHIVLGARNHDTPRLQGMIDWTRRGSISAQVHDMLAQDFFAVFDRAGLFTY